MYSTATDLQKLVAPNVLDQLSDDGAGAAATAEEVIAEAIDQADTEIDSYFSAQVTVPMDPPHPLAANLSAKMALYNLFRRRPHVDLGEWGEEYKRCVALLKRIAEGKISVTPSADGEHTEPLNAGGTVVITGEPYFGDLESEGY